MRIKTRLKHTWSVFFSRFFQLTPIQKVAIPFILEGKNVIVCSPTASGKTEAVIAPLVERLIDQGKIKGLSLLYLAPTRALLNNLYNRLNMPLARCGLKALLRTGDRPYLPKTAFEVLFTTPESLDSLLCRHLSLWKDIKAIIIDEIHFLDNTYRGDQLRILMRRLLKEHLSSPPQFVALSATLSHPEKVARRYFEPVEVVQVGEPRPLKFYLSQDWAEVIAFLRKNRWHKAIIFCNRRRDVENLYLQLSHYWPKERILVHHGSLSRRLREETEALLRRWRWGLCICTSTLEIGIDIGDFDVAICYHLPPTPSAFQQRIGRASRRQDYLAAIGFYEDAIEANCFELYASLATKGMVEEIPYTPDPSVIVQQTFSLLFAHPSGLKKDFIFNILKPLASEDIIEEILLHLRETDWIEERNRKFFASERLMNLGEKGLIHSNIPNEREFKVIEMNSNRHLGEITTEASPGSCFVLGGKVWEIVKVKKHTLLVRLITGTPTVTAFHRRLSRGAFTYLLPAHLTKSEKCPSN